MGNYNRDNGRSGGGGGRGGFGGPSRSFGGGGRSFGGGGRSFGGGRDGGKPAMHQATCSECGASCELPFKPTGDRPVFCSTCFGKQQDGGGSARPTSFGGERRERPRFEDKQMHDAICGKCGKECQVPFRPMAGKSVFCNDCFEKGGSKDSGEVMEQLKALHAKVDKLMAFLNPKAPVEKAEKAEVKKEVAVKKEVVKEKKEKAKAKVAPKKVAAKKKK